MSAAGPDADRPDADRPDARRPAPRNIEELDPTGRFTDRAADYAAHRPSYPLGAVDALLEGLPDPHRLAAADLGAGTGIMARLLGDRGVRVWAVEPNAAMRAAAAPHPFVSWVDATGEATTLPDGAVDLVVVAQAFHWFHLERAAAEVRRVLVPGGRLGIVYNHRALGDPVGEAYERSVKAASVLPSERLRLGPVFPEFLAGAGFLGVRVVSFASGQFLDVEGLLGRARSASYVPASGPAWDRLETELRALHAAHADGGGRLLLRQRTEVVLAETPR